MARWSPSRLTPEQLEARRMEGARLLRQGRLSPAQIARTLGVSRQSVSRWGKTLHRAGRRGLSRRPHTGRPPKLRASEWRQLERVLARGAAAAGFDTERWTLRRVGAVVRGRFGITYHCRSLGRVLRAHGWSPQRPPTRAAERDEDLIAAWLQRDWPRIKRGLVARGGRLPSWTRQVTRFGPASARRGRRWATPRYCAGSASGVRCRA